MVQQQTVISAQEVPSAKVYTNTVAYEYVLESELTLEERQRIISELPSSQVGEYSTYYMIYRPAHSLPHAGEAGSHLGGLVVGTSLLIIGVLLSKNKKTRTISSIVILTMSGSLNVEAITSKQLAHYNHTHTLEVGSILPTTNIAIDNYEFVGYILEKDTDGYQETAVPPVDVAQKPSAPVVETTVPKIEQRVLSVNEEKPQAKVDVSVDVRTEILPFETITVQDATRYQHETLVAAEGQAGEREITTTTRTINGEVINVTETAQDIVSPVNRVVVIGTKAEEYSVPTTAPTVVDEEAEIVETQDVRTEVLPFDSVTVEDATRYQHETLVVAEGQTGEREITTITRTINGEVVEVVESVRDISAPVNRVTVIGTKAEEVKVPDTAPRVEDEEAEIVETRQTRTEPIPFEETTVEDSTRFRHEQPIVKEGQAGEREITTITRTIKGVVIETTELTREITPAIDKVTIIGTKAEEIKVPDTAPVDEDVVAVVTTNVETRREDIPYEEEVVEDPNRYEEESPEVTAGQVGIREITTVTHRINGEPVATEEAVQEILAPTNQIRRIGTKVDKRQLQAEFDLKDNLLSEMVYTLADLPFKQEYDEALAAAHAVLEDKSAKKEAVKAALTRLASARNMLNGSLKEKPTLTISTVVPDNANKKVAVTVTPQDPSRAITSGNILIYHQDELIRTVPITSFSSPFDIPNLDYYTDYVLKPEITYDLGTGAVTELQDGQHPVRLEYKKIEFKDIDAIELFKVANQQTERIIALKEQPADPSHYFVKIKSDRFKDALLPVSSIALDATGKAYDVRVSIPELVQDVGGTYENDLTFKVSKSSANPDVYLTFTELIRAMKQNPAGIFYLGANMNAEEVSEAGDSYILGEFTGTLNGSVEGENYSITNLKKPLFSTLRNATVQNLDLKRVDINTTKANVGSVAQFARKATIQNVAVEGNISAAGHIGGIVFSATEGTTITNTSFKGRIHSTAPKVRTFVGGIVGNAENTNTLISKSKADVNISVIADATHQKAGSLVGLLNEATLRDSHAKGTITNTGTASLAGHVGGIIGSGYRRGNVSNIVNEVSVTNGYRVVGQTEYNSRYIHNVYNVAGKANGTQDRYSNITISEAEVADKVAALQITATTEDSGEVRSGASLYTVDYTQLPNAQPNRAVAYRNVERLAPFYNKEFIVYYGNKVDEASKLFKTELVDVVPMVNQTIVTDVYSNQAAINRLMLHYADNTVSYVDVAYSQAFANEHVVEYRIGDTELIYTPEQFVSNYQAVVAPLVAELNAVELDSNQMRELLKLPVDTETDKLSYLYLTDTFNAVKQSLVSQLSKALAQAHSVNTSGSAVTQHLINRISQNKEAFMLGMTYLQRWYAINYGDINTKDLNTFKFDFFGNQSVDTIEALITIGQSGYQTLVAKNNVVAYSNVIAPLKGKTHLFDYIEAYRHLFLPNKTNNQWLKENSKAYIVEAVSNIPELRDRQLAAPRDDKFAYGVYDKLTQKSWPHQNMILTLLTMTEESVYVFSNLASVSIGGYEKYHHDTLPAGKDAKTYIRELVDRSAIWQRDHFDFWYRLLTPASRDKLASSIGTYDGYNYQDSPTTLRWRTLDDNDASIQQFFGPINKWYRNNGLAAYANGEITHMVLYKLLNNKGASAYTHEMVHNFDSEVYFEGNGRRDELGAELFALGLLQSPETIESSVISINHIFNDFPDSEARLHTISPNTRLTNPNDLQSYVHGMFDVIYMLDYAEAQGIVKQTDTVKKAWLRKLENYHVQDSKTGKNTHAGNIISPLTDAEVARLTTWESLIDNSIINSREYPDGKKRRDGYYTTSMFSPIYSALDNPTGLTGDIMFRRMAFELLAAKGYHEGFIPYISGKFNAQAEADNSYMYSGYYERNMPVVTDTHVFNNLLKGQYDSWTGFKKAMFNERIAKLPTLKPITIRYELGKDNTQQQLTITNYAQLQDLIDKAIAFDARYLPATVEYVEYSEVNKLKAKIYNAYLRSTDDFRTSIFE